MITRTMIGISALISFVYVIADEIAVNYMMRAHNGAAMAAAARPAMDLSDARRQAKDALKDLQAKKADAGDRSHCRDQAWPYYSGACLVGGEERPARILAHDRAMTASAGNLMQAANF